MKNIKGEFRETKGGERGLEMKRKTKTPCDTFIYDGHAIQNPWIYNCFISSNTKLALISSLGFG